MRKSDDYRGYARFRREHRRFHKTMRRLRFLGHGYSSVSYEEAKRIAFRENERFDGLL